MKPLVRLFPRLLGDRLPRAAVATALVTVLLVPLHLRTAGVTAAGVADGLAASAPAGLPGIAGLMILLLASAAAWLGDGTVSELRTTGSAVFLLTRPVSCAGYVIARWLAAACSFVGASVTVTLVLEGAFRLHTGFDSGLSVSGAAAAALVTWTWVGSTVLLLSAVPVRGEGLFGVLVLILPLALGATVPPGGLMERLVTLPPSREMLEAARALISGGSPGADRLVLTAAWGGATLAVGLGLTARSDWRPEN